MVLHIELDKVLNSIFRKDDHRSATQIRAHDFMMPDHHKTASMVKAHLEQISMSKSTRSGGIHPHLIKTLAPAISKAFFHSNLS